jgi:hypothetical protein
MLGLKTFVLRMVWLYLNYTLQASCGCPSLVLDLPSPATSKSGEYDNDRTSRESVGTTEASKPTVI